MSEIEPLQRPPQEEERQEKVPANPEVFKAYWQTNVKFPQGLFDEAIPYAMLCPAVRESVNVRDFYMSEPTDEQIEHALRVMINVHAKAEVTLSDPELESIKRKIRNVYESGKIQTKGLVENLWVIGKDNKVIALFFNDIPLPGYGLNQTQIFDHPLFSQFFERLRQPFEIIEKLLDSDEAKRISFEYRQIMSDPTKRNSSESSARAGALVLEFRDILINGFFEKTQEMFPDKDLHRDNVFPFFNMRKV